MQSGKRSQARSFTLDDAADCVWMSSVAPMTTTVSVRPPTSSTTRTEPGTPAVTTRGFKEAEVVQLAGWIADVLDDVANEAVIERTRQSVLEICRRFPVYG